jgi:hypothetical protein
MATSAQYSVAPTVEISQVSTANANRDGSGTTVEVAAGPSTAQGTGVGKRIAAIVIQATGTTTAGMIRFFLSTDGGTTKRMIAEVPVVAQTPSATAPAFQNTVPILVGLVLQGQVSSNSCKLYASTEKAETFNIHVFGSTY